MIPGAMPDRRMDMLAREREKFLAALKPGEFFGEFRLEWIAPNRWRYHPIRGNPFGFRRASGKEIIPKPMVTDGGSIPRLFWALPGLSPWDYGPAFLVHDWEFHAHDLGIPGQTFKEVNLTLAEGILTLMQRGYNGATAPVNHHALLQIHAAVDSSIGRKIWNAPATP